MAYFKGEFMKYYIFLIVLITSFLFSSVPFAQENIPSSSTSQKAIIRVRPQLENEFVNKDLNFGSSIFIRIFKMENELEVWVENNNAFQLFKTYTICTYGGAGLGPKLRRGDGKAPEGFYFVRPSFLNPYSSYHLSFNLGYPNRYDREHNRTGSALMVHGYCVSIGCYAMTDRGIEEIYTSADAAFRNGQSFFRVHIFPFKMSNENMREHEGSEWYSFWVNLKEGYDFFEENGHNPPNVEVENNHYVFGPS